MAQRNYGIHVGSSACWQVAGQQCHQEKNYAHTEVRREVGWTHSVEEPRYETRERGRSSDPESESENNHDYHLLQDDSHDADSRGSQSHANPDLVHSLSYTIRKGAEKTCRYQPC